MDLRTATLKLTKAAKKMMVNACSCSSTKTTAALEDSVAAAPAARVSDFQGLSTSAESIFTEEQESMAISNNSSNVASKNLCAICLEALSYGTDNSPGQAIFTAQCSHTFHFTCISSNVRHGNINCPICRACWTQLPFNLKPPCCNPSSDPILRILDESIATFRDNRHSIICSAYYDDDDPTESLDAADYSRLDFSLTLVPNTNSCYPYHQCSIHRDNLSVGSSSLLPDQLHSYMCTCSTKRRAASAFLSVKLAQPRAMDLILVVSPNGPHLRLLKQLMAIVVFSLRQIDRLSMVTCSSSATRVFPLRRMTSYGKRTAIQIIERIFHTEEADPTEGIKKGLKILEDRVHKNPLSCILHLSDCLAFYQSLNMHNQVPIHHFHVGINYDSSGGFVIHEFKDNLARTLMGMIQDVQLRIGEEEGRIIKLGELKGDEGRRIRVNLNESGQVWVAYRYTEGEMNGYATRGETMVSISNKNEPEKAENGDGTEREDNCSSNGRASSDGNWDLHDPFMARRWSKYLHGYRL